MIQTNHHPQVLGVKLTGDGNVPAGEVTFRAKVGHRHKMSTRGMLTQQLDIMARYVWEMSVDIVMLESKL